jgi:hypothetical protein
MAFFACGGVSVGTQKLTRAAPSSYADLHLVKDLVLASMKKNTSEAAWRVE